MTIKILSVIIIFLFQISLSFSTTIGLPDAKFIKYFCTWKETLEDYSEINGQRTPSETMREENYFVIGFNDKADQYWGKDTCSNPFMEIPYYSFHQMSGGVIEEQGNRISCQLNPFHYKVSTSWYSEKLKKRITKDLARIFPYRSQEEDSFHDPFIPKIIELSTFSRIITIDKDTKISTDHIERKIIGIKNNKPYQFLKVYKATYECELPLNNKHALGLEQKAETGSMPQMFEEYIYK